MVVPEVGERVSEPNCEDTTADIDADYVRSDTVAEWYRESNDRACAPVRIRHHADLVPEGGMIDHPLNLLPGALF